MIKWYCISFSSGVIEQILYNVALTKINSFINF